MPQIEVSEQQIIDALHWLSPRDAARRFGVSSLARQLWTAPLMPCSLVSRKSPDSEVSTGRSSPTKNASVSWMKSSTK